MWHVRAGFRGNYTAWLKAKAERSRVAEKSADAKAKRMQEPDSHQMVIR